jgi:ACS family pantothenate transporter-like MFS transporter
MSELISNNAEQRAFTAAAMNTLQCKFMHDTSLPHPKSLANDFTSDADTFTAWIPLVWFQQVHQPNGLSSCSLCTFR